MLFLLIFIAQFSITTLIYTVNEGNSYQIEHPHLWIFALHVLVLIFAPIQAGFSDHFCRRKSLIIAIFAIVLSQICLYLSYGNGIQWKVAAFIIVGLAGHVIPISRAAIMDISHQMHITEKIGYTTIAVGLGWVASLWGVILLKPIELLICIFALSFGALVLVTFYFSDPEDKRILRRQNFSIYEEANSFTKMLKKYKLRLILSCYFLIELGFYIVFRIEEVSPKTFYAQYIITVLATGYSIGVFILVFLKKYFHEFRILKIGFFISGPLIIVLSLTRFWITSHSYLFYLLDFFFAFGVGWIVPPLLATCSKCWKNNEHFQGKVFGLVESTDTLSLIVSSLILAFYMPIFLFYLMSVISFIVAFCSLKKINDFKDF
jgi:MFS family permease